MAETPECPICKLLAESEASGGSAPGSAASLDVLSAFAGVWTDPAHAKEFLAAVRLHMQHSEAEPAT